MVYILILVLASAYGGTPLGTTNIEFASEAACKATVESIKAQASKDAVIVRSAMCVKKG